MKSFSKKYLGFLFGVVFISILIGLILKTVITNHTSEVLLVYTKVGPIQGYLENDGEYYSFLGIPYATVNKSMPFGESIAYPAFKDVHKANDDTTMCPQQETYNNTIKGSLDCLNLNIYVPEKASGENRLPVLVYIFGGRYKVGFARRYEYGPKYLIDNEIIFITINYRVGPYGFMCLDIPEVPGNQGLKDQINALRWIKQNIAEFGGDPDKITVAGSSSSGQDVLLHLVYGKEKLFNQAIIESGITQTFHAVGNSDPSMAIKIAADLGYTTNHVGDALNFLSLQKSHAVIASSVKLNLNYSPCVEKKFDNKGFITEYLTSHIANVDENIPILVGQANNEKLFEYADKTLEADEYQYIFQEKLNDLFVLDKERLTEMTARVRQFYIGDEEIAENVKQQVIDFLSDLDFNYPIQNFLNRCLKSGAGKIYHHVFSYTGSRNLLRMAFNIDLKYKGATHVDQIGYLFEIIFFKQPITAEDQLIADRMTELWTNFVKYGDPVPVTSVILPVKCQPATNNSITYLEIDKDLRCGVNLFHNRMAYWDLFYELNGKYEKTRPRRTNATN